MKRMKIIVSSGLLVLLLGMVTNPTLGGVDASPNQSNWEKLKQLSSGQEIQVVQNDTKSTRGNFRSVTDEAIVVSLGSGEQTISRQSILRVSSKGRGHRVRNALIGAGIGAGAGLGVGAVADSHDKCKQGGICLNILPNGGKEIGTPLGALGGAIVGAVLSTGGWHEIYRAR
jgi:hypothetical protein